jgi:hypothetical protein
MLTIFMQRPNKGTFLRLRYCQKSNGRVQNGREGKQNNKPSSYHGMCWNTMKTTKRIIFNIRQYLSHRSGVPKYKEDWRKASKYKLEVEVK